MLGSPQRKARPIFLRPRAVSHIGTKHTSSHQMSAGGLRHADGHWKCLRGYIRRQRRTFRSMRMTDNGSRRGPDGLCLHPQRTKQLLTLSKFAEQQSKRRADEKPTARTEDPFRHLASSSAAQNRIERKPAAVGESDQAKWLHRRPYSAGRSNRSLPRAAKSAQRTQIPDSKHEP
jgi:hypothetical protein